MHIARRKEREFWTNSPEYKHMANRMGSEFLAKMMSKVKGFCIGYLQDYLGFFPCIIHWEYLLYVLILQHLENVIKSRIPGLQSLISKTIVELESELSRLGKPVATDAGVSIYFP